jgi:hypothetical protein
VLEVASVGLTEDGEELGVALTQHLIHARERAVALVASSILWRRRWRGSIWR